MSMQSHYEFSVSYMGVHLFATAPRSCVDKKKAIALHTTLNGGFPSSAGYHVSCAYWEGSGTRVNFTGEGHG